MLDTLTAVVTGGSAGIGAGLCRHLTDAGATVVNIDIHPPSRPQDERYFFFPADLADPQATRSVANELAARFPINSIFNNAGVPLPADLEHVCDDDFEHSFNLHMRTPLILAQAFVPTMKQAGFGRIANISTRAILGKKARTSYASSKAGLVGLTRSWALELGPSGITANAIAPGPVMTDLFKKNNPPEIAKRLVDSAIVGRAGTPDDIARAALFFAAPENGYITGQVLHVCGGSSLASVNW